MKTGFKLALITLPIAAIGAAILGYIVVNTPPPERIALAERANAVRVIAAERLSFTPSVTGFGVVVPERTFEAVAEVVGRSEFVNPVRRPFTWVPPCGVGIRFT